MRLPDLIRAIVPHTVHELMFKFSASQVSDDVRHRYAFGNSMWWSLENIKRCGFRPGCVLDVGAFIGDWTQRVCRIWPEARYLMVEPQPNKHERLRKLCSNQVQLAPVLAGPFDHQALQFHMGERGGSSVFQQVDGHEWDEVTNLTTRTLDSLVAEHNLSGPFLLKADVQGYELEVLRGADRTLIDTEVILLETSLMPYNAGSPLFAEVVSFMSDHGFVAYDFCSFWRRQSDDAAFQVDVIFVREHSQLRSFKAFFTGG
jgi:FkbM family methyltransferase